MRLIYELCNSPLHERTFPFSRLIAPSQKDSKVHYYYYYYYYNYYYYYYYYCYYEPG
jgi:hypothetical protein